MNDLNQNLADGRTSGVTRSADPGSTLKEFRSMGRRRHPYEPDMRVVYHVLTKSVLVTFRGDVKVLGPYGDRDEAVEAAEDFCRQHGWKG